MRAGGLAQPQGRVLHGLGAQGAARAGRPAGPAAAAGPAGSARLPPAVQPGPARAVDRLHRLAGGTRRGPRASDHLRGGAAAVRRTARPAPSAGPGPGPRLSAALSAGSRLRAAGRALVRGGSVPAGAARCLPGVGRPHARSAHRADPQQRPLCAGPGRAGPEPGLARTGEDDQETGPGLGAGARSAALVGGDLRAKFATGNELQGGRLAVRGTDAGAAAGSGRGGGDEGGLAAGFGCELAAEAGPEAGAEAGAVPGVGAERGGELGTAGVPAFGPAGRAAAAAAGADGAELGAASGGGSAGNLPAPGGPAGGDAPFAQ